MIRIDFDALNPLERKIHATLSEESARLETIRIKQAADLCDCSVSKISKFTKKLGFVNFKQYVDFLYGKKIPQIAQSTELLRLTQYLQEFDGTQAAQLAAHIEACDKLVLLGYGPSFLCAQYFEYKFKTCIHKVTIAAPDELTASSIVDDKTLLLIFTVTGTFASFETIYQDTKRKGGDVALIVEEYNPALMAQYDKIFCLTKDAQPNDLQPFEKTRTVFFIFMEEVIRQLMAKRNGS